MAKLKIYEYPDPVLKQKAAPVEKVDDGLRRLLDDMLETMYAAAGVGLAAPQVGVLKRVIVIDTHDEEEGEAPRPLFLVNPEIVARSEEKICHEEGMSVGARPACGSNALCRSPGTLSGLSRGSKGSGGRRFAGDCPAT